MRPDAILATNTSYLDPDVIAAATSRPERVRRAAFLLARQRHAAGRSGALRQDRARCAGDRHRGGAQARQAAGRLGRLRGFHRQPHLLRLPPRGRVHARGRRAAARDRCGDGSATASPWGRSPCSTSPGWRSPGRGASARPRRATRQSAMSTSPTGSARPDASARRPGAAGTPIPRASARSIPR